jgi:hypothetical protein
MHTVFEAFLADQLLGTTKRTPIFCWTSPGMPTIEVFGRGSRFSKTIGSMYRAPLRPSATSTGKRPSAVDRPFTGYRRRRVAVCDSSTVRRLDRRKRQLGNVVSNRRPPRVVLGSRDMSMRSIQSPSWNPDRRNTRNSHRRDSAVIPRNPLHQTGRVALTAGLWNFTRG